LLSEDAFVFAVVSALLSLIVGSFLNVVIHRLPIMMERAWSRECREFDDGTEPGAADPPIEIPYDLMRPRSRCPSCNHLITALENIPVLSYLALRGRCRHCSARISPRYPLVELLTAILSAITAYHFGFGPTALGALVLTWGLVALTFIDLDRMLLPDSIVLPLLWLGLGLNLFEMYTGLHVAVVGAMVGYLVLWVVYHAFRLLTGKEGMGHGDFKLTAMLGAWMGWTALPGIILVSSLVGAICGIVLIGSRRMTRARPIPFGPFLAAAGWLYLLWGVPIERAYLGLLLG